MYRILLEEAVCENIDFKVEEQWLEEMPLKQGYLFTLDVEVINERKKINKNKRMFKPV